MLLNINSISADDCMEDVIEAFIAQGHEGTFWDFKMVWPQTNVDLIHDIVCMANNLESNTGYIICGIDESSGCAIVDVRSDSKNRKNTQQLNNMLWSQSWAYSPPIVEVVEVNMGDGHIDVIVIHAKEESQPYYFTKSIKKDKKELLAGAIYTRIKDSNTPINETASLQDTEMLWKRHFGLNLTPLERFPHLLSQYDSWIETLPHPSYVAEAFTETFYHQTFPEFTFMVIPDENRNGWEYYMLVCPFNLESDWCRVRFYYHNTLLTESLGVYIDHHFFPVPKFGVIPGMDNGILTDRKYYYYYIESSLNDRLEQFYLHKESDDYIASHRLIMDVIPRYKSETEKSKFEEYLRKNQERIIKEKNDVEVFIGRPNAIPDNYREDYLDVFRDQAEYGAALVRLLKDYRNGFLGDE